MLAIAADRPTIVVHCECPGECDQVDFAFDREKYQSIKRQGFAIVFKGCRTPRRRSDILAVENGSYRLYYTVDR